MDFNTFILENEWVPEEKIITKGEKE